MKESLRPKLQYDLQPQSMGTFYRFTQIQLKLKLPEIYAITGAYHRHRIETSSATSFKSFGWNTPISKSKAVSSGQIRTFTLGLLALAYENNLVTNRLPFLLIGR